MTPSFPLPGTLGLFGMSGRKIKSSSGGSTLVTVWLSFFCFSCPCICGFFFYPHPTPSFYSFFHPFLFFFFLSFFLYFRSFPLLSDYQDAIKSGLSEIKENNCKLLELGPDPPTPNAKLNRPIHRPTSTRPPWSETGCEPPRCINSFPNRPLNLEKKKKTTKKQGEIIKTDRPGAPIVLVIAI